MPPASQHLHYYITHGLTLCADSPLPELTEVFPSDAPVDLTRAYMVGDPGSLPWHASPDAVPYYLGPYRDEANRPVLRVWRTKLFYRLLYTYGVELVIGSPGDRVWCGWDAGTDYNWLSAHLLGPALGFILRLRGVLALHASTVIWQGNALAFVGPSGSGKSTLAAQLCKQGCQMLSDDIAALSWDPDGKIRVQPGHSRVKLWPDSAEALYGANHNLLPVVSGSTPKGFGLERYDKRYLDLKHENNLEQMCPAPLKVIYLIDRWGADGQPKIKALDWQVAMAALDSQSYASRLLDREQRSHQLKRLARLCKEVPARRLGPTNDLARLPSLANEILEDFSNPEFANAVPENHG